MNQFPTIRDCVVRQSQGAERVVIRIEEVQSARTQGLDADVVHMWHTGHVQSKLCMDIRVRRQQIVSRTGFNASNTLGLYQEGILSSRLRFGYQPYCPNIYRLSCTVSRIALR